MDIRAIGLWFPGSVFLPSKGIRWTQALFYISVKTPIRKTMRTTVKELAIVHLVTSIRKIPSGTAALKIFRAVRMHRIVHGLFDNSFIDNFNG